MGRVRNRLQSLFGLGGATAIEPCTNDNPRVAGGRQQSTSFASALVSHFRSHSSPPIQRPPVSVAGPGTQKSPLRKQHSALSPHLTGTEAAAAYFAATDQSLPYGAYDSYNSGSRLLLDTGGGRILKTFFSDSLVPLEDEGVGRLKAVYEAWLPRCGAVAKDKIGGIYSISLVCANRIEGTIQCDSKTTKRSLQKHHVECLYAGTGIRSGCATKSTTQITSGVQVWIKGSLPITGPWVQSMYIPPDHRLNKLCLIAAPKPDFSAYINAGTSLVELPELTAKQGGQVFELDSNVYIYICRLSPCSSVCHTAKPVAKGGSEPPVFEIPKIRRSATLPATSASSASNGGSSSSSSRNSHPIPSRKSCKSRSLFIHSITSFDKHGAATQGGSCLLLPGSIQLKDGDGIHLKQVIPGADIPIKNIGFDRAQFIIIDMPGYNDDADDAKSI
ncbi:hypothetical protein IW140_000413 [Coemansia sp. RSA 1813]|nr:hypothetical protein EV178_000628 [Coemansia sp. RSA 1646]KAJ1773284.1 hypothetical protein LPJ74_000795 [Coemansia sp. RSA 1843]KAJ2217749.1 hypothetical protein EV179_000234 [Coemansia sp. RSA 487]KAJ2573014.1 hypothetical protein IW140_000413 [Coemansia sp. RSA 1813]